MADDPSVLVPGTGYIYVAPPGTALPDLSKGFDPKDSTKWGPAGLNWKSIGNTSLDNGIEMSVDGDEPEVLGSWQQKSLRTTDPSKTYAVTINLSDFTAESYRLYYGTDKGLDSKGLFSIPTSPTAQNRALMIAAVDGTKCVAWHYPKTSIIGADSVTMDPAALGEMPVKATVVALNQSTPLGSVTPVFDLAAGLPAGT